MSSMGTACGVIVLALVAVATAPLRATDSASGRTIHASYVLLTEAPSGSTVAFARVIVDRDAACPRLVADGAAPITTIPRENPHGFPVTVCEAAYPIGRGLSVEDGPALPRVDPDPRRLAVLGDTGCKPKDQEGCGLDDPAWPFPALARAAAGSRPDLVLHLGDYNYRGTPSGFTQTLDGKSVERWYYDAGDGASPAELCGLPGPYTSQNSSGNPDADSWEAWRLDFFEPARELLAAAPWVFTRGNHELCSHAGPGWFYFLDGSSRLADGGGRQLACPSQDGEGPALPHLQLVEPRVLHLGELDLLSLDSANACDQLPGLSSPYRDQLATAIRRLRGGPAWLATHRPIWGLAGTGVTPYDCDGQPLVETPPLAELNRSLQCALQGEVGAALLPALDLVLAGHMHRFEALSFAAPSLRPPTLIVGNSGIVEESGPPVGAFAQAVGATPAAGFSVQQFGYLELQRGERGGWSAAMVAVDPAAWSPYLAPCGSAAVEGALCVRPLTHPEVGESAATP